MPEQKTIQRAREDKRAGKAASTQSGEFVREEFHHIREGKHGARSTKQAIAIGLSKARRAGVRLPPPRNGKVSARSQKQAARDNENGSHAYHSPSKKRSRAVSRRSQTRRFSSGVKSRDFKAGACRCKWQNGGPTLRCRTESGPHKTPCGTIEVQLQ